MTSPAGPGIDSSRRSFLQFLAAATAAVAAPVVSEGLLAHAETPTSGSLSTASAVHINANENPLGPSVAARAAVTEMASNGGRYDLPLSTVLAKTFAEMEDLDPHYVMVFPGSSLPLHYSVLAFTSAQKSYVTADPGYEAGMYAAKVSGARVVKTPLMAPSYAHDVRAMLAAAPDAGIFYICNPNNPTGTTTNREDIQYLLSHKPKGSLVLIDEAYIHFSDATPSIDLVKNSQDVIVLRTFSKIYGMAGLRCGFAIAHPDTLAKLNAYSGWNAMPITAVAAATVSLKDASLIPTRKNINANVRANVFAWLTANGYSYIPSQSNCFMIDTKRPGKQVIAAMASQNVYIGRTWPIWPNSVRITVGTQQEMDRFKSAFQQTMNSAVISSFQPEPVALKGYWDQYPA